MQRLFQQIYDRALLSGHQVTARVSDRARFEDELSRLKLADPMMGQTRECIAWLTFVVAGHAYGLRHRCGGETEPLLATAFEAVAE